MTSELHQSLGGSDPHIWPFTVAVIVLVFVIAIIRIVQLNRRNKK